MERLEGNVDFPETLPYHHALVGIHRRINKEREYRKIHRNDMDLRTAIRRESPDIPTTWLRLETEPKPEDMVSLRQKINELRDFIEIRPDQIYIDAVFMVGGDEKPRTKLERATNQYVHLELQQRLFSFSFIHHYDDLFNIGIRFFENKNGQRIQTGRYEQGLVPLKEINEEETALADYYLGKFLEQLPG